MNLGTRFAPAFMPVDWRPLEPVVSTVAYAGLTLKAPHPHAALLFIDWLHSKEGQLMIQKGGLWSPREDIGSLTQKFKKSYIDEKYGPEEAEKKYAEWDKLNERTAIVKKRLLLIATANSRSICRFKCELRSH